MTKVSNRLNRLAESATLAMARMSRELQEQGHDVIALSLGEPDFDTPDFIKQAAKKAIDDNFSHYTPVPGLPELRNAIVKKFKRDNNLEYTADQVVTSTGAKQSLANIFLSVLDEGDEVIIFAPYWVTYYEQIKLAQGVPVVLQSDISSDYKINPEELKEAINEKTKLIIFSSPCNPSGTVFSKENLSEIADIVKDHPEVVIISDEIYELINFEGKHESIAQFDSVKEQTVIVNGVSKGFAMTGYRIGYMGAPKWVADSCTKIQGQFTSGASSIAQMAAKKAVLADPSEISFMRDAFMKRRDLVKTLLDEIKCVITNVPEGAFYHFPDVSALFGKSANGITVNSSSDLAMYLLSEAHVAVVGGDSFGNPNNIRLSYAASEDDLKEALSRMKIAIEKLS